MTETDEAPRPRILLSVEDAAAQLALSRTRLYGLIKTGEIVSVRIGRLRRVPGRVARGLHGTAHRRAEPR